MKLTAEQFLSAIKEAAAKEGIEVEVFLFFGYKKGNISGTMSFYFNDGDDRMIPDMITNIKKTIELKEEEK